MSTQELNLKKNREATQGSKFKKYFRQKAQKTEFFFKYFPEATFESWILKKIYSRVYSGIKALKIYFPKATQESKFKKIYFLEEAQNKHFFKQIFSRGYSGINIKYFPQSTQELKF